MIVSTALSRQTAVHAATFTPPCGDVNALIGAIVSANASPEADTITLAQDCLYTLTGVDNETDGPNGLPSVTGRLTVLGNGATIARSQDISAGFRFLHVAASGSLSLADLTLSNGSVNGHGGAIFSSGALTLTGVTVSGNEAFGTFGVYNTGHQGGGIYTAGGSMAILASTLSQNEAAGNGGAIRGAGAAITIRDSLIEDNSANEGRHGGGGLYVDYSQTEVTIVDSTFRGNQGGAMRVGGHLTLHNSLVEENVGGSAAVVAEGSILDMANTTIRNNGDGSAIQVAGLLVIDVLHYPVKSFSIRNSTISGNRNVETPPGEGHGKGGEQYSSAGISWWTACCADAVLTIENTTISGNRGSRGGGIEAYNLSDLQNNRLVLNNVTVTDNVASQAGGGIYERDGIAVEVSNSIIAGNSTSGQGADCHIDTERNVQQGTIASLGHNLSTVAGGCDFDATGDQELASAAITSTVLFPLADNGGPTPTHLLRPGSPALETGSPAAPGAAGACTATDQRGLSRPRDGDGDGQSRCDIGALEATAQPTDISLFPTTIHEKQPVGTAVGALSTQDLDVDDQHQYSLVPGAGDADNGAFTVQGTLLQTAKVFDVDLQETYFLRVRSDDGYGGTLEKSLTVKVLRVDNAPLARNDSAVTDEDQAVSIPVLENDEGELGETLTIVAVGQPGNGTATSDGTAILYTPAPDFNGQDSFFYRVQGSGDGVSVANVFVTVRPVADPPSSIALSKTTVAENQPAGTQVGSLSSTDPDGDTQFIYSLVPGAGDDDNGAFRIQGDLLLTRRPFDYEAQPSYRVRIRSQDLSGLSRERRFTIQVLDLNDPPTAIQISNNRIRENEAAGTLVGVLTALDPDVGDSHRFALVAGSGSSGNRFFQINGNILSTAEPLDYEFRTRHTIRVRATDSQDLSHEQELTIQVVDVPTPPDQPSNVLGNCNSDAISLIDGQAKVTISQIAVSDKTVTGCRINGLMTVQTNGTTVSSIPFAGAVNAKNQLISSAASANDTIGDFQIPLAGLLFRAAEVEIEYDQESPRLRIYRPSIGVPDEWGGLSKSVEQLTVIDDGGIKFGAQIQLPTITVGEDSYELNLWAELIPVSGGYEFETIGSLTIPNVASNKQEFGEKRKTQECEIGAQVRIFAGAEGQTVMVLNASVDLPANPLEAAAPELLKLRRLQLSFTCAEGIPIANTGFALKSMAGTLELTPDEQSITVDAEIVSIKELSGMPLIRTVGSTKLTIQPAFAVNLNVALFVLAYRMAEAEAHLTASSFSTTLRIQAGITRGTFSINAWTTDGRFHFTGSGSAQIELQRGEILSKCTPNFPCPTRVCRAWGVPYPCRWRSCQGLCVRIPPNSWLSPSVNADFGEFSNGAYGLKGYLSFAGTTVGFYVDHRGRLTLGNVNQYTLVESQAVLANRQILREAKQAQMSLNPDAFDARFHYPNERTVLIDTPIGPEQALPLVRSGDTGLLAASTVISSVNLIQQTDLIFTLSASEPLTFSLLAPNGDEITPHNYASNSTYAVAYSQQEEYELARELASGEDGQARLRYTAASANAALESVDVQLNGTTIYSGLRFDSAQQSDYIAIAPGSHTVTVVPTGGGTPLLSQTFTAEAGMAYGAVSVGAAVPALVVVADDNRPPTALRTAKVRLLHGVAAGGPAGLQIGGTLLSTGVTYGTAGSYVTVPAGDHTVRIVDSSGAPLSELLTATFAAGHVYTILSAELAAGNYSVAWMQRMDEAYEPRVTSRFDLDQAPLGEWRVKLEGDLERVDYLLSVDGPSNPPILDDVTVDAANPTQPTLSWRVTSDYAPTAIEVYLTPGPISQSLVFTDSNGVVTTQEQPRFEGFQVAAYEIGNTNQLGGQLIVRTLDLSNVTSGSYYLWIRAQDGVNPPVSAYAAAPGLRAAQVARIQVARNGYDPAAQLADAAQIQVDNSGSFPVEWQPQIRPTLQVTVSEASLPGVPLVRVDLLVEWEPLGHPDVDRYTLHVGRSANQVDRSINAGLGVDLLDADGRPTGARVVQVRLRTLEPGATYYLAVEAFDDDGARSVRSSHTLFSLSQGDFTLQLPTVPVQVAAGSAVVVPLTVQVLEPLLYPNVSFGVELSSVPRGIGARFGTATGGSAAIIVEVDPSVAEGSYAIIVSGTSSGLRRTAVFDLAVGPPTYSVFVPQMQR